MKTLLVSLFLFYVALAQPNGTPRQSGAGFITTDCSTLRLGEEAPFPNYYVDEVNNYLYPNLRLLQSQRELPNSYRRTFHFPTYGCVDATFNVLPNLPVAYAKGIFATPRQYRALLRFSGFDQEVQNTSPVADTKGLAIKLYGVTEPKLLPGFEDDDHMDIVFNAFPVFPFNNETVFSAGVMSRTQINGGGDKGGSLFGSRYPLPAARSVAEHANNSVSSVLLMPFYAISPYKYGLDPLPSPAAKYRVFPCDGATGTFNQAGAAVDHLTVDMTTRLAAREYCFVFQVQLQTDACLHPINDFGVEWLETDAPYVTVATLNISSQVVQTDSNNTCRHAAMNAWRVPEAHRPLGSLNRARLFAMMNSHNQRLALNNVVEPVTGRNHPGFQYWLPTELGINSNFRPPVIKTGFPAQPLAGNFQAPKGSCTTQVCP